MSLLRRNFINDFVASGARAHAVAFATNPQGEAIELHRRVQPSQLVESKLLAEPLFSVVPMELGCVPKLSHMRQRRVWSARARYSCENLVAFATSNRARDGVRDASMGAALPDGQGRAGCGPADPARVPARVPIKQGWDLGPLDARPAASLYSRVMSGTDASVVQALSSAKLEALVEMMFLAASADGEFSQVERGHFLASVESLTDGRLDSAALDALLVKATADLEAGGREQRLLAVKERLPDPAARQVALSLAIQVTAADGIIRTSERELIMETAEALGIDLDVAADLVKKLTPS